LRYYFLFFLTISCIHLFSQSIDFDQVVIPEGQPPRNFEDCLVQLAWLNSPGNKIYEHHIAIASNTIEKSKREWLEDIALTFNLNETHFSRQDSALNNNFYPRYNLGASFNLGKILNRKYNVNISEEEKKIAELEENQQKLEVRAEVLRRYEHHLLAVDMEQIRLQAEKEAADMHLLASEKFKTDKIDFQDYNSATEHYNMAKAEKLRATSDVQQTILALEELIGVPWEKVIPKREVMAKRNKLRTE